MRPVMQIDITFETGNCGEACVASILEIPLENIPRLYNPDDPAHDGNTYCRNLREFLGDFGLSYLDVQLLDEQHDPEDFLKNCWVIATGPSPRATEEWHRHAVVWRNGKIVHDPHPSQLGLDEIDMYGVFIKRDPKE